MLQANPSFYANVSEKNFFISATTYEKHIACKDYCIAHYDDKTCFQPVCKYRMITPGELGEVLQKLDTFCFTYQHVNSLHTLSKHRFKGKIVNGIVFDNVQMAIFFNQTKCRVLHLKNLEKKFKHHFVSSLQKANRCKTVVRSFNSAERIEKA